MLRGVTWIVMLAVAVSVVIPTGAQVRKEALANRGYRVIDLGTYGGPQSYVEVPNNYAPVLNDRGIVAGWADTATSDPYPSFCFDEDCFVARAFVWIKGSKQALPQRSRWISSQVTWLTANGMMAGVVENGEIDPLVNGFPELRGVLWANGSAIDLGALPAGGYESYANAVNGSGVVVGMATDTTPDPNSIFGLFQTHAFRWDAKHGMEDLGTLGGTDATATLINARGQIVGESYLDNTPSTYCRTNLGLSSNTGVFLWERGIMEPLAGLGGTCSFASDLNNNGVVVGLSTILGDTYQHAVRWADGATHELANGNGGNNAAALAVNEGGDITGWASLPGDIQLHATLWAADGTKDLGTLPDFACSAGTGINAKNQVIGFAAPCDFSQQEGVLWENGEAVDLNTVIVGGANLVITVPETINDEGEIAGIGLDPDGNQHAFLMIPCEECGPHRLAARRSAIEREISKEPTTAPVLPPMRRTVHRSLAGERTRIIEPMELDSPAHDSAVATTQGILQVSPTSLNFGSVPIGERSAAKTVTLQNEGKTTVLISGITITGDAKDFTQTHTCKSSLTAGASCNVSVTFAPAASGARTAALTITDNAGGSPQTVPLNGTGYAPRCIGRGGECWYPSRPCCRGLQCVPTGDRAVCE